MCRFIKEDGERCGRDTEPFCHQHDETPQSHFYHTMEELDEDLDEIRELVDEAVSDDLRASNAIEMDATCEDCGSSLRRTERLREHPNRPDRIMFDAIVECDCDETRLGSTSELKEKLNDGWY